MYVFKVNVMIKIIHECFPKTQHKYLYNIMTKQLQPGKQTKFQFLLIWWHQSLEIEIKICGSKKRKKKKKERKSRTTKEL